MFRNVRLKEKSAPIKKIFNIFFKSFTKGNQQIQNGAGMCITRIIQAIPLKYTYHITLP